MLTAAILKEITDKLAIPVYEVLIVRDGWQFGCFRVEYGGYEYAIMSQSDYLRAKERMTVITEPVRAIGGVPIRYIAAQEASELIAQVVTLDTDCDVSTFTQQYIDRLMEV